LLLVDIVVAILRTVRRCPAHPIGAMLWLQIVFFAGLLFAGLNPEYEGSMLFPTFRQIPGMLQIALCAGVFCFAPFPAMRKKRLRPAKDPA